MRQFKSCVWFAGQLPDTSEELLKLDQVFIKSELKVGVIYVKEGQSIELAMKNIIFTNTYNFIDIESIDILNGSTFLQSQAGFWMPQQALWRSLLEVFLKL